MISIPDGILSAISQHRPNLAMIVEDLKRHPHLAGHLERQIAQSYLQGTSQLGPQEIAALTQAAQGQRYGGGQR